MATPTPQPEMVKLPPDEAYRQEQYKRAIHYTSLGVVIICPLLIALPPRTLLRTSVLLGFTGIGANQLAWEYSGASLFQRSGQRVTGIFSQTLPPKALEIQSRLREERARMEQERTRGVGVQENVRSSPVVHALSDKDRAAEKGILEKVWLGGEDADWKAKRDAKEKEALEDGRGYWGLITEQIWEVWSWGKEEVEEIKEEDEKVVDAKKGGE